MEKLIGYKPNEKMEEHFMRCMQRYMKESASILRSYFSIELKIAELQFSNDNYKGFAKSCKKLSSELEGAISGIVERNFRIAELERKVKEAEQEHLELLLLRQEKQEWDKVKGVLRKKVG